MTIAAATKSDTIQRRRRPNGGLSDPTSVRFTPSQVEAMERLVSSGEFVSKAHLVDVAINRLLAGYQDPVGIAP